MLTILFFWILPIETNVDLSWGKIVLPFWIFGIFFCIACVIYIEFACKLLIKQYPNKTSCNKAILGCATICYPTFLSNVPWREVILFTQEKSSREGRVLPWSVVGTSTLHVVDTTPNVKFSCDFVGLSLMSCPKIKEKNWDMFE